MADQQTDDPDYFKVQSKIYDKILKENMREVLPALVKDILGIHMVCREDLPESLQHTKEMVPDQLSKITDDKGQTYILHIEWQSTDDPGMDQRMLNYRAMLRQKYGLLVKQYVISLAGATSKMPCKIDEENLKFSYKVISLQQYSHKIFLDAVLPEQKLMAIFGNFDNEAPVNVIQKILMGIAQQADGKINGHRYKEQFRALVQLRKLSKEFKIAMGIIAEFKVEEDAFYQDGFEVGVVTGIKKGIKKGEAKWRREEALGIAKELKKEGLSVDFIAKTTKLHVNEISYL